MKTLRFLICALGLFSLAPLAIAQSLAPQTIWVNDRASQLGIQSIGPDGSLRGTYSNGSPNFRCQNLAFPVVGWVDGDRISFTVRWMNSTIDCTSITSWTGYLRGGELMTEWALVYLDSGENRQMLYRGTDHFVRK